MKKLRIPQKVVYKKFYVRETVTVNLSKKVLTETCKQNNHDLNRDRIKD